MDSHTTSNTDTYINDIIDYLYFTSDEEERRRQKQMYKLYVRKAQEKLKNKPLRIQVLIITHVASVKDRFFV